MSSFTIVRFPRVGVKENNIVLRYENVPCARGHYFPVTTSFSTSLRSRDYSQPSGAFRETGTGGHAIIVYFFYILRLTTVVRRKRITSQAVIAPTGRHAPLQVSTDPDVSFDGYF